MDFKKPSITGIIAAQRASRFNGSSSSPGTPAVDRMMLDVALGKVAAIEKTLEAARDAARVTARRAGVSLSNLFGETAFVPRSTASRWCDEAREEGANERNALLIRVFQSSAKPDPKFDGARAWAARMLRDRRAAGFADDAQLTPEQQTALINGTLVAADPGAAEEAAEAEAQARIEANAKVNAEKILAAARLRDAGGPPLPEPAPGSKAARIIAAAKKAHPDRR
jgi:hypothetical protein